MLSRESHALESSLSDLESSLLAKLKLMNEECGKKEVVHPVEASLTEAVS